MELNYAAFFLISFVPLLLAYLWYHPKSPILHKSEEQGIALSNISIGKLFWAFLLSLAIVYGYMNLIIHQLGFYELFFTDIMKGSEEAKIITSEFLAKYGQKHRHFGHGVLHGAINAFLFALPLIGFFALLEKRSTKFYWLHLGYWLITSMIVGGLISEFV